MTIAMQERKKYSQAQLLVSDRHPIGLGCVRCEDREICGGINIPDLFDCWPLCCGDLNTCDYVCPRNVEKFVEHLNEIDGFEFDAIFSRNDIEYELFPHYVPLLFNSSNRIGRIASDFVAIQLSQLIDFRTGQIKFNSPAEMSEFFGYPVQANVLISGVAEDVPLENYWYARHRRNFVRNLAKLNPKLVTGPNFSSFSNAPRWDNMFNLKRIEICWKEFVDQGIPTSLHMNGRTLHDWSRWTDFIKEVPAVRSISFEFATISPDRRPWYADRLVELAKSVKRDLQLVVRGGLRYLSRLNAVYADLVFIDTNAFIKSAKRQQIQEDRDASVQEPCVLIDELLEKNLTVRAEIVREIVENGRVRKSAATSSYFNQRFGKNGREVKPKNDLPLFPEHRS